MTQILIEIVAEDRAREALASARKKVRELGGDVGRLDKSLTSMERAQLDAARGAKVLRDAQAATTAATKKMRVEEAKAAVGAKILAREEKKAAAETKRLAKESKAADAALRAAARGADRAAAAIDKIKADKARQKMEGMKKAAEGLGLSGEALTGVWVLAGFLIGKAIGAAARAISDFAQGAIAEAIKGSEEAKIASDQLATSWRGLQLASVEAAGGTEGLIGSMDRATSTITVFAESIGTGVEALKSFGRAVEENAFFESLLRAPKFIIGASTRGFIEDIEARSGALEEQRESLLKGAEAERGALKALRDREVALRKIGEAEAIAGAAELRAGSRDRPRGKPRTLEEQGGFNITTDEAEEFEAGVSALSAATAALLIADATKSRDAALEVSQTQLDLLTAERAAIDAATAAGPIAAAETAAINAKKVATEGLTAANLANAESEREQILLAQKQTAALTALSNAGLNVASGLATGAIKLRDIGKTVGKTIGDLAVRTGAAFIGIGEGFKALITNPFALTAIGVGLVGAGLALQAFTAEPTGGRGAVSATAETLDRVGERLLTDKKEKERAQQDRLLIIGSRQFRAAVGDARAVDEARRDAAPDPEEVFG